MTVLNKSIYEDVERTNAVLIQLYNEKVNEYSYIDGQFSLNLRPIGYPIPNWIVVSNLMRQLLRFKISILGVSQESLSLVLITVNKDKDIGLKIVQFFKNLFIKNTTHLKYSESVNDLRLCICGIIDYEKQDILKVKYRYLNNNDWDNYYFFIQDISEVLVAQANILYIKLNNKYFTSDSLKERLHVIICDFQNKITKSMRELLELKNNPIGIEKEKTLTWLHLSDLHMDAPATAEQNNILELLIVDLKNLQRKYTNLMPDLIFLTGDLVRGVSGKRNSYKYDAQFAGVIEYIEKLYHAISSVKFSDILYVVPGNHDINRSFVNTAINNYLDTQSPESISVLIEQNKNMWPQIMKRLSNYINNIRKHKLMEGVDTSLDNGLIYYDKKIINDINIGISGINTAWSCSRKDEENLIWFGLKWQLEFFRKYLINNSHNDVEIALMHHPFRAFSREGPDLSSHFESIYTFCLHGHEHRNWVRDLDTSGHTTIAAGASSHGKAVHRGYNIVHLNYKTGDGYIFLRKYNDEGSGGWIPNCIIGETNDNGIKTIRNFANWKSLYK